MNTKPVTPLSLEPIKAPISTEGHITLGRGYKLPSSLTAAGFSHAAVISIRRHREMKRRLIDGVLQTIGACLIGLLIASPMYLAGLLHWWHA